jgi:hypothetical protein
MGKAGWKPCRPPHRVKVKNMADGRSRGRTVGSAWLNENGPIKLHAGTTLAWNDGPTLVAFPTESKDPDAD